MTPMRILIVGGGPAGLYFALLMKRQDPSHEVTVIERDGPDDTFGWGIVFSDQTFDYLRESDAPSFEAITAACEKWDNVDIVHRGERITVRGNRFSGIARIRFLNILQERCRELGVELRFHQPVDGSARRFRRTISSSAPTAPTAPSAARTRRCFSRRSSTARNKYIWLGTPKLFHGLTLTFVEHPTGVYAAHSYKFDGATSTFIVECSEATWRAAGARRDERVADLRLARRGVSRSTSTGEPLLTKNFVKWLNFPLVRNARWYGDDVVLLGDALHTAHFSIGSGTKLALEDAIVLAAGLRTRDAHRARRCRCSRQMRRPRVEQYQQAATGQPALVRGHGATTCTSTRCRLPWKP